MPWKMRTLVMCLAIAAVIECGAQEPSELERSQILERVTYDLDGDGINDTLLIYGHDPQVDPDFIKRLDFKLSKLGARSVFGEWDYLPSHHSGFSSKGNLVNSKFVYINKYEGAGVLVFIFGNGYSCCAPQLDAFQVSGAGVRGYWHEDQLLFLSPIQPTPGAKTRIVGARSLSESLPPPTADYVRASAHSPPISFLLGERVSIDLAASERFSRDHFGGYSGIEYRADVIKAEDARGKWHLWNQTTGTRLE